MDDLKSVIIWTSVTWCEQLVKAKHSNWTHSEQSWNLSQHISEEILLLIMQNKEAFTKNKQGGSTVKIGDSSWRDWSKNVYRTNLAMF